jgi:UDP-N-acetylmuramate--alanine ligase
MSGIAEVLLNHGYTVQGSDLKASPRSPSGCAKARRAVFDRPAAENLDAAPRSW